MRCFTIFHGFGNPFGYRPQQLLLQQCELSNGDCDPGVYFWHTEVLLQYAAHSSFLSIGNIEEEIRILDLRFKIGLLRIFPLKAPLFFFLSILLSIYLYYLYTIIKQKLELKKKVSPERLTRRQVHILSDRHVSRCNFFWQLSSQ